MWALSTKLLPCSRALVNFTKSAWLPQPQVKLSPGKLPKQFAAAAAIASSHPAFKPLFNGVPYQNRWYTTKENEVGNDGATGAGDVNECIYIGSLAPRMRAVKIFSLSTSLAGLAAQPILMEQGIKLSGTGLGVLLCGIAGFFTFVTPVLLHFVTKKYVTEMRYNAKTREYTATTISILLQKIDTKFQTEDVIVPEVPGMFTTFLVGKQALFVDPSLFDDLEHYVRIMGYDKPVDFKLELGEKPPLTGNADKQSK